MFPVIDERESFADSIALVYVSGFVSVLAAEERVSVIALSVSESFSVSIAVLSESAVVVAKSFRPLDNEPKMLSKSVLVSESAAFERFEKSFAWGVTSIVPVTSFELSGTESSGSFSFFEHETARTDIAAAAMITAADFVVFIEYSKIKF
jgi:hypothetical protein